MDSGLPTPAGLGQQKRPRVSEENRKRAVRALLERNAGLSRQNLVDTERIRYMERILQHYVPNISFDIQSLRKTAEELKHRHRHSFTDANPSVRLDEEDFEDLAIDDEDYMVKALPDNTTPVGTQFAHMESAIPVNRPPVDLSSMEDHHFSEDEVGLTFYQFASKLVPDILATVSIRSVQACLLIGTYLLPLDTSGLCYTYFGLALKMAIQNGMHRRYQGEGLSPRMIEVRNRVFWTAYTIEK
ncbi:hypothetical protein APSETT444_004397 [Aspergillus pseudonomiae]